MRQVIKTADGELTFGSMAEVKVLYERGFIGPEDLIRPEDFTRWVKAGTLSLLRNAQTRGKQETSMGLRVAMAVAVSVILAGLFEHNHGFTLAGLVALGVFAAFFAYRRR